MNNGTTGSYAYGEDWSKSSDWLKFRRRWLKENLPFDNGCYLCGICGHWVKADEATLDHIRPRRADNIFDPGNIQPAHWICNYKKGSQHWEPKVSIQQQEFLRLMSNM